MRDPGFDAELWKAWDRVQQQRLGPGLWQTMTPAERERALLANRLRRPGHPARSPFRHPILWWKAWRQRAAKRFQEERKP